MIDVHPIDTLHVNDNYAWAIIPQEGSQAYIVDPGEAEAVVAWLDSRELRLAGILVTHRHWDHVDGVQPLLDLGEVPVWGPDSTALPPQTIRAKDGERLRIDEIDFDVLAIPGHTREHIAYYCAEPQPKLFCGDTLFAAGCGRVFDGQVEQLYQSLRRLAQLPPETQIYCAHEYTLANLAFAQAVEPDNAAIITRRQQAQQQREQGQPTLPSQLDLELQTNPFLRCHEPAVVQAASKHAGRELVPGAEVFAALRRWKDAF